MRSPRALRYVLGILVASLTLAISACGGSGSPASTMPASAGGGDSTAGADPSCPVAVPGTSVTAEDTNTGAALVFITTGDVADLRKRVASMAQMHNDKHGKMGPLPTGAESGGHDHAGHGGGDAAAGVHAGMDHGEHAGHAGGMIAVHSKAETAEIDGGARLVFISGAADVGKLQTELRNHAQHLSSGSCSMGSH